LCDAQATYGNRSVQKYKPNIQVIQKHVKTEEDNTLKASCNKTFNKILGLGRSKRMLHVIRYK